MRTTGIVLLVGCLALGVCATRHALAASLATDISDLTTPATQRSALERMLQQADPAWRSVLQALKEGALYRWQDILLVFTADGTFVDLQGQPLLDSAGQPLIPEQGLEQVPLAEANLPLLQRGLDAIDLFAPEAATRQATVRRLSNLNDVSLLPVLDKARQEERDAGVRAVLTEAVYKLQLLAPDAQIRRQAVEYFGTTRAESALGRLREMAPQEPDAQVRAAVAMAISTIERYLWWRNTVGYVFNGISLASVLLIMSLGLAVTFGLMGIINMAHGEMLMLGSYTAYVVQEIFAASMPGALDAFFLVALPLSFILVGAVGMAIERGILRWLYGRPLESLLVTWGLGMVLQQGARLYFGDQTSVSPPTWLRGGWEIMPGLIFPYSRLCIIALSGLALMAVYLLLYRSDTGLKIRSVMQHRDMAACMGIAARKVDTLTFALGTALAGVAGCALSLIGTVDPEVGKTYIVDAFMVVVLGGVGKLFGTVLASLGVGVSNKLLEPAIGGTAAAVYAKVGILVLVIFFLQLKPTGLFPAKDRTAAGMVR